MATGAERARKTYWENPSKYRALKARQRMQRYWVLWLARHLEQELSISIPMKTWGLDKSWGMSGWPRN